jgi:hypothetical protein
MNKIVKYIEGLVYAILLLIALGCTADQSQLGDMYVTCATKDGYFYKAIEGASNAGCPYQFKDEVPQ